MTLTKKVFHLMPSHLLEKILSRLSLEWELAPRLSAEERSAIENIHTVVIPLGSYRNLTTMTGAIYALHPNAIVLNHAWIRLGSKRSVDFLRDPNPATLARFISAALRLAQGGRTGDHGGSILKSHAFRRGKVKQIYSERYGDQIIKPIAQTLFWKESMRLLNHITDNRVQLPAVVDALPQLRFLLPVRHLVNCADSTLRTGHWRHLLNAGTVPSRDEVIARLFDILLWFEQQRLQRPDKFMYFWEFDLSENFLRSLCTFSGMPFDEQWSKDVLSTIAVEPKERLQTENAELERHIETRLRDHAELAAKTRAFLL